MYIHSILYQAEILNKMAIVWNISSEWLTLFRARYVFSHDPYLARDNILSANFRVEKLLRFRTLTTETVLFWDESHNITPFCWFSRIFCFFCRLTKNKNGKEEQTLYVNELVYNLCYTIYFLFLFVYWPKYLFKTFLMFTKTSSKRYQLLLRIRRLHAKTTWIRALQTSHRTTLPFYKTESMKIIPDLAGKLKQNQLSSVQSMKPIPRFWLIIIFYHISHYTYAIAIKLYKWMQYEKLYRMTFSVLKSAEVTQSCKNISRVKILFRAR